MVDFIHQCKYQGIVGQAVAYRRSEGLQPEFGSIDLSMADLKKIRIQPRINLWRAANKGFEVPSPVSINTWEALTGIATVERPSPLSPPADGGLLPFGDLEMVSFRNRAKLPNQVFRDVYVARSGMEEVGFQVANIRNHNTGIVRVPLTDIRQFYREYGSFVGRINVVLPSGEFDRDTIKNVDTCEPWSATDVLSYLFSQLPGSPIVVYQLEDQILEAPPDVIGRGDVAVVQILEQLLQRMGLVAKLQPDNNYLVAVKASDRTKLGTIPVAINDFQPLGDEHYERETVWATARPHAVHVFGQPPIRRVTLPYTPVFRDLDNRWYSVFDAPKRWGWKLASLLQGITMGHEKRWRDIPKVGTPLHHDRKDIARRDFFKVYAPSHLFATIPPCPGRPTVSGVALKSFAEEDFERAEYLPMKEAPLYTFEFGKLGVSVPVGQDSFRGDRDFVSLVPPIVRGAHFGQDLFTDFAQIEAHFKVLKTTNARHIGEMVAAQKMAQSRLRALGEAIVKQTSDAMLDSFVSDKAKQRFWELINFQGEPDTFKLDDDLREAFIEAGVTSIPKRMVEEEGTFVNPFVTSGTPSTRKARRIKEEIDSWKAKIALARGKGTANQRAFNKLKGIYKEIGGVQLKMNVPHTVIKSGYTIDERTGMVTFGEPFFQAADPFVLDGDSTTAVADGEVYVTFGYEVRENNSADITSVLFNVEEDEATGKTELHVVGGMRPTTLKGKIVRAPKMRMYQTDIGEPMNANQVIVHAATRAEGLMQVPRVRTGRTYELIGFQKVVLEGGVNSTQFTFDGTKARTTVMVNAPSARGPLGPADVVGAGRENTDQLHSREMVESNEDLN